MNDSGPLNMDRWRPNKVLRKRATEWNVDSERHLTVHWRLRKLHITHTDPVTSHPTQRQAPLTINYNHVDSYTRVLLYVAHTNLMLQPSVLRPRPGLGVTELQMWLC